ncbi:MAG: hypothetical protein ACKO7W_08945 [Elainella sp.]
MPKSTPPPDLQTLALQAAQLSVAERSELISILEALNQAEEQDIPAKQLMRPKGIRGGRGSFEDKYINGYGPYRYLRYWYGKTHKSVYLGKVRSDAALNWGDE